MIGELQEHFLNFPTGLTDKGSANVNFYEQLEITYPFIYWAYQSLFWIENDKAENECRNIKNRCLSKEEMLDELFDIFNSLLKQKNDNVCLFHIKALNYKFCYEIHRIIKEYMACRKRKGKSDEYTNEIRIFLAWFKIIFISPIFRRFNIILKFHYEYSIKEYIERQEKNPLFQIYFKNKPRLNVYEGLFYIITKIK